MTVTIGDTAPDFTLPTDSDGTLTLSSLRGKNVILYFYPKDDTPGCTKQACGFRDALPDFSGANAEVIGVSKDGPKAHDKFKAKYDLPFTLVSDPDAIAAQAFGVWKEKKQYGRSFMGMERSTFLIDAQGVIRGEWRKVKVDGHVEEVLAAAKAL